MSRHWPRCASCCDIARIGSFFAKGIKFLEEGGGREKCIEMGFGGNGAVVSPWSVLFFLFFAVWFCELQGEKMAGKLPLLMSISQYSVVSFHLGLPTLPLSAGTCFVGVPWKLSTSTEVSCYMSKLSDVWRDLFCQCCIHLESLEHISSFFTLHSSLVAFPPPIIANCALLDSLNCSCNCCVLFFLFDCSCWYDYHAIDAWTNGARAGACASFGSGVAPGARS